MAAICSQAARFGMNGFVGAVFWNGCRSGFVGAALWERLSAAILFLWPLRGLASVVFAMPSRGTAKYLCKY